MTSDNPKPESEQPSTTGRTGSRPRHRRYYGRRRPRRPSPPGAQDPKLAEETTESVSQVIHPGEGAEVTRPGEPAPETAPAEALEPISQRIGESPTETASDTEVPEAFTEPGPELPERTTEYEAEAPAEDSIEERAEAIEEQQAEMRAAELPDAHSREPHVARDVKAPVPPSRKEQGSAISQAIQKVLLIMADLKDSMEQMEQVLELLEEAERQQMIDERELRNLQRALESMHRGRGEQNRSEQHGRGGGDHGRRSHEHRGSHR